MNGEQLTVPERMIVAPSVGVFRAGTIDAGMTIAAGDVIGTLEGPGTEAEVRSPFDGMVMGILAHPGERLRAGQPVAWLRVA